MAKVKGERKRFVPLVLDLIDEGRFLNDANDDLLAAQESLCAFVAEHGDNAKKAKVKLQLEITIMCDEPAEGTFSIKAVAKRSLPIRPPAVNIAIADSGSDGVERLHVRSTGGAFDSPRQGHLAEKAEDAAD